MTLVSKRTELTVETLEVLIVRPARGGGRSRCEACGGENRARAAPDGTRLARLRRLCAALLAQLLEPRR